MSEVDKQVVDVTMSELFGEDSHYQLVIPLYQRPYRWTKEEARVLLDDLNALIEQRQIEPETRYSLGTLVTVSQKDGRLAILDGQQRLTTVWLLRSVLKAKLSDENGYRLKIAAFEYLKETEKSLCFENEEVSLGSVDAFIQTDRGQVFEFFYQEVFDRDKAQMLFDALECFVDFRLVSVALSQKAKDETRALHEASEMFDIINARGMPLTLLDVLKAKLISKLPQEEHDWFDERWCSLQEALERQNANRIPKSPTAHKVTKETIPSSFTVADLLTVTLETTQEQQKPVDEGPSPVKAPISFTLLLVIAREIWKASQTVDTFSQLDDGTYQALTDSDFVKRFDVIQTAEDVGQLMDLLEDCVWFTIDYTPYREVAQKTWKWPGRPFSAHEELQQFYMASNNYQDKGQNWLLLGAGVYHFMKAQSQIEHKPFNEAAFLKHYEAALSHYALREVEAICREEFERLCAESKFAKASKREDELMKAFLGLTHKAVTKTSHVLWLAKAFAGDKWPTADGNPQVGLLHYHSPRWAFYWVDWLLLQDAKKGFQCYKAAFKSFLDFGDKDAKNILKMMRDRTTIRAWSSLEHWMAQKDVGLRDELQTEWINSFGNLALIDQSLNSQFGNKWTEQKSAIAQEGDSLDRDKVAQKSMSPKLRTLVALKKLDKTKLVESDMSTVNAAWNRFVELAYEAYGQHAS